MYNIVKKKPSIWPHSPECDLWPTLQIMQNWLPHLPSTWTVPTYVCVPARDKTAGVNTTVHLHGARTNDGGP